MFRRRRTAAVPSRSDSARSSASGLANTVFPSHLLRVGRPALRFGCGCAAPCPSAVELRYFGLSLPVWVKPAAEENIERMHGQGEFTESIGGRVVESARFEPSPCPLETEAQRQMFIGVAQRAQKSAHLVRALAGGPDGFQRGG
jgi:predicted metal-binding transcription factor (methanogenesis marker protein 9)